jgi:hypothetical protein
VKIYTRASFHWDGHKYIEDDTNFYEHDGLVLLCCGASAGQTAALNTQTAMTQQFQQQSQQVFGNSSSVFNDLMSTFAPTVAAGPSQQGFSAAENSNLQSQAITQTGQAYKNAKEATGEAESAQGGGNNSDVTGGAKIGTDLSVANSAAAQTSSELGQINEANYATGRQNYDTAVQGLAGAPNVFNAATGVDNAATNSASQEANTANQIATQNNSWIQGVTGALGGIAGGIASGGMSNLGKGVGFFGGSSSN